MSNGNLWEMGNIDDMPGHSSTDSAAESFRAEAPFCVWFYTPTKKIILNIPITTEIKVSFKNT